MNDDDNEAIRDAIRNIEPHRLLAIMANHFNHCDSNFSKLSLDDMVDLYNACRKLYVQTARKERAI
jgi:hypothetical protein